MKRLGVMAMLLVTGTLLAQTWQAGPATTFAFWRFDGEYFAGTNKVYFLGGRLTDASTSGAVWSFDPVARTYTNTTATMPTPVSNYEVALLLDNYDLPMGDTYGLYIVGGRVAAGTFTNAVQVYYPVSNRVRTLTSDTFPGKSGGVTFIPNSGPVVGNKMYTLGGFQSTAVPYLSNQTWIFDPLAPEGSRWTAGPNLNIARGYIAGAPVDSMLYACGGDTFDGTSLSARPWVEKLNTNNLGAGWTRVHNMPSQCGDSRAIGFGDESPYGFGGHVVVCGHGTWSSESVQCYLYHAEEDSWSSFPPLNTARRNHAAAFIPGDANSNGVPGLWVWGGRYGADTSIKSVEYFQLSVTGIGERATPPTRGSVLRTSPNPFRSGTAIDFTVARPGSVTLSIYRPTGVLVRTLASGEFAAGTHGFNWDGRDGAGHPTGKGIYVCRLVTGATTEVVKLVKSE
jgi:hypothetical protein